MLFKKGYISGIKLFMILAVTLAACIWSLIVTDGPNKEVTEVPAAESTTDICESVEPESITLTDEEIELIALVVMAEAEGECDEGKRLVIDTILNRVDSKYWPDTVSEVIWQPNQFTSMWNGRADRCYVTKSNWHLVMQELESRTNYDVVYFTAGAYGKYGKPMFQVGNHYFASYD